MTTKEEMIQNQLLARDIVDPEVLRAMQEIDRENFVPEDLQDQAYHDRPLPIGKDQTISQPYIVAFMAQQLQIEKNHKILEVGTGCGYNAAVLSRLASQVYSIEIIEWLSNLARKNLTSAGITNVSTRKGDGYQGWPAKAPFDAIVLTAAPPDIPAPLKEQLRIGGKILAPVGRINQQLVVLQKTGPDQFEEKTLLPVRFVPMTGRANHGGTFGK